MITGRLLTTVVLLQGFIISLTAAACGPAPTVNLDCSDKGKASIGWQNDCDQDNCGMILSCTDSTGSTHNTKDDYCSFYGWEKTIPLEIYNCTVSVYYIYNSNLSPYGVKTCAAYNIDIQPAGNNMIVGDPLEIRCSVNTADITNSDDVTISWTGPNGTTITNDSRLTITPTVSNGTNHISILQFSYLSEDDDGLYECSSSVLGYENNTASINLTNFTIPTPNVLVTALNNQQVGDPLLLECNVTTVRGITSSVDIVWSTNGTVVKLVPDVSPADNSVVYRSTYEGDGLLLSEQHNGVVYQCIASINSNPLVEVNATHSIVATDDHTSSIWPTITTTLATSTLNVSTNSAFPDNIQPTSSNKASNPDTSQSAIIISAIAVMVTFVLIVLTITCFIYKKTRQLQERWGGSKATINMVSSPFDDDNDYSVIAKEAPSTCEYLENEKVLHWIKDTHMQSVDEESASVQSEDVTSIDMLNLVYGGDLKVESGDCSESISGHKDPYIPESVMVRKTSSLIHSAQNSPTTINGYVKVDIALDSCFSDHSGQDQTQTTSTTTTSLEGSYTDHYSTQIAPSSANETVNDETALDSCNIGEYCEHIPQGNNSLSTSVAPLEGSYIDHNSVLMESKSRDQTMRFLLTTSESIKVCCDSDIPYVALSEDVLPLSARSSPEGDLDSSAHTVTTDSDNNSILHAKTGIYVDESIAAC